LDENPIFWILPGHTKSGGTPADPGKSLMGKRIVSFPGSGVVSGTIIASAILKLLLAPFWHLMVKKLTLDKIKERHYSPNNFNIQGVPFGALKSHCLKIVL
jgi:membrane glycosyltransferase